MRTASIIAVVIAAAALATMMMRHSLIGNGVISVSIQIAAIILMLWARITFKGRSFHASADPTEGGLVTTGPYRYWRHPIYASVIYVTLAALGSHFDIINLGLAVVVTAALSLRMWAEETLVVRKYPEYVAYAARTKRVIPFVL